MALVYSRRGYVVVVPKFNFISDNLVIFPGCAEEMGDPMSADQRTNNNNNCININPRMTWSVG